MADVEWLDILDWGVEELEDLRFIGYSYLKQGKYDVALTFFEALAVLNPENVYDLQTLGGIHLQLDNNLMALNYIERSLKLDSNHLPTQLNRAKALFALGYKRQAMTAAQSLTTSEDKKTADQASALVLAYS